MARLDVDAMPNYTPLLHSVWRTTEKRDAYGRIVYRRLCFVLLENPREADSETLLPWRWASEEIALASGDDKGTSGGDDDKGTSGVDSASVNSSDSTGSASAADSGGFASAASAAGSGGEASAEAPAKRRRVTRANNECAISHRELGSYESVGAFAMVEGVAREQPPPTFSWLGKHDVFSISEAVRYLTSASSASLPLTQHLFGDAVGAWFVQNELLPPAVAETPVIRCALQQALTRLDTTDGGTLVGVDARGAVIRFRAQEHFQQRHQHFAPSLFPGATSLMLNARRGLIVACYEYGRCSFLQFSDLDSVLAASITTIGLIMLTDNTRIMSVVELRDDLFLIAQADRLNVVRFNADTQKQPLLIASRELSVERRGLIALYALRDGRVVCVRKQSMFIALIDEVAVAMIALLPAHSIAAKTRDLIELQDGRLFAAYKNRGPVLWDAPTALGEFRNPVNVAQGENAQRVAVLPDGRLLASLLNNTVILFAAPDPNVNRTHHLKSFNQQIYGNTRHCLATLPDGRFATTSSSSTLYVYTP